MCGAPPCSGPGNAKHAIEIVANRNAGPSPSKRGQQVNQWWADKKRTFVDAKLPGNQWTSQPMVLDWRLDWQSCQSMDKSTNGGQTRISGGPVIHMHTRRSHLPVPFGRVATQQPKRHVNWTYGGRGQQCHKGRVTCALAMSIGSRGTERKR
jgi:hypothetical protein